MTRRKFLQLSGAMAVGGAVAGLVPLRRGQAAPELIRLTERPVVWDGPGGLRLAQLTDVHVGWATGPALPLRAAELACRARPDLVVLTGDYVNRSLDYLPELRRFLARLPRPIVATLGNHDYWAGAAAVQAALEQEGILVLRNESRTLELGGRRLTVIGVDDSSTHHADVPRAFAGVLHPGQALILTHNPAAAEEIAARGGRLILAGHTHGGQFAVPGVTAAAARLFGMRYLAGWYRVGPARLYVNAGIGSSTLRRRVGRTAVAEVALLELVHGPDDGTLPA